MNERSMQELTLSKIVEELINILSDRLMQNVLLLSLYETDGDGSRLKMSFVKKFFQIILY
jgi:hypothetical protein